MPLVERHDVLIDTDAAVYWSIILNGGARSCVYQILVQISELEIHGSVGVLWQGTSISAVHRWPVPISTNIESMEE